MDRQSSEEKIKIVFVRPPEADSDCKPPLLPARSTIIYTADEFPQKCIGLDIKIEETETQPCYVKLNRINDEDRNGEIEKEIQPCYVLLNRLKEEDRNGEIIKHNQPNVIKRRRKRSYIGSREKQETCAECGKKIRTSYMKYHKARHSGIKPYPCDLCTKKFAFPEYLKTHMQHHMKEKTSQCSECSKSFITENHLNRHIKGVHRKPFACGQCPMKYALERTLKTHMETHSIFWTEKKTFECYICGRNKGLTKWFLKEHMRTHTGEKPFACDKCPRKFAAKYYLKIHQKTHDLREKCCECKHCHKKFFSRNLLRSHMLTHLEDKPFKCDSCPNSFSRFRQLNYHKQSKSCGRVTYLPKEATFQCYICEKMSKTLFRLRKHLETHSDKRPFSCDECPKKYKTKGHLIEHKKFTHRCERPFVCSLCSKTFKSNFALRNHCRTHAGEKPFICNLCSRAFSHASNLHRHQVWHKGERKFSCNECPKTFLFQRNLNLHKATHLRRLTQPTKERKYFECYICKFTVKIYSKLKIHMRLHTGEKPFHCDVCSKSFRASSNLISHKKTHTQIRAFACAQCGKTYKLKGNLRRHELTHVSRR